ncbi:hypothetical protein [Anaerotignum sp.]
MKKRMLAVLFAAVLVCGVAGCGSKTEEPQTEEQNVEETVELDGETQETADQMQAELQGYATDLTAVDAAAAGLYTIENGAVVGGQENWDAFAAGKADTVIVCQFSKNGGAMLDYVKHLADGSYLVVTDITRDGYEYSKKEDYTTKVFECLTVLEGFSLEEGSAEHTVCVLSNEAELDANTFRTYWNEMSMDAHQVYPLFII